MGNLDMLKPSKQKRQKRRDKRLHEELIECYRAGGGWIDKTVKGYQKRKVGNEYQYSPKQERMKVRSGGEKYSTDNLQPLLRFLDKNTGKYWDKLYSELCKKMSKDSLLGQHLFDHLSDFVETNVYKENGKLMVNGRWGSVHELGTGFWCPEFYVHPVSGVLLKIKKKKRRRT